MTIRRLINKSMEINERFQLGIDVDFILIYLECLVNCCSFLQRGIPKLPWVSILKWYNDLDDLEYHHFRKSPFIVDFMEYNGV